MANRLGGYRVQRHADDAVIERTREITRQSVLLLRDNPKPDSFAGRKTQEPFPQEAREEIIRWITSRELQPPD